MYKYIITLTTIPSKFQYLHLTIDSIVKQTIMPDKIIINIPNEYNFRLTGKISDDEINDLKGVSLNEDYIFFWNLNIIWKMSLKTKELTKIPI